MIANPGNTRRRSCTWVALLLVLLCATVIGCGFEAPKDRVWVTPTVTLQDAMYGRDVLLGDHATCKVRYGGSSDPNTTKTRHELFLERWSGDQLLRTQPIASFAVPPEGFTRRMIVSLKGLPPIGGREDLELLSINSSEAKEFTLTASVVVEDFPLTNGIREVTAAGATDQSEFGQDDEIPLVAFHRGTSSGKVIPPFAKDEEVLLVKMRLR